MSGSWDEKVRVWDASSGACLFTLADHTYGVTARRPDQLTTTFALGVDLSNLMICFFALFIEFPAFF